MAKKYDYLWKGIVEDLFEHLLRFLYPGTDKAFDLKRGVTFLDAELEQLFPPEADEYAPKVDMLVRLYTHDGEEEWVLLHIEVQGHYKQDFSQRMLTYYLRILDKYNRPITAYAILTEESRKPRPTGYERSFLGTQLIYRYNVLKVSDLDAEDLFADPNPFALAVLVAKSAFVGRKITDRRARDKVLLETKLNLKTNTIFEMEKRQLTGGSDTMGIEQLLIETEKKHSEKKGIEKGIEQGAEQKSYEVVGNLLAAGKFTDSEIANFATVTEDFVKKVRADLNKKKK